ncbi:phosphoribosyltransferase domain-containing protein [Acinetobacter sp. P1(2025)]|uniref:phosphoribosyltransferase domain-containing protein n=1 Tax=Acinetobacter sp. P1(2025) TaxID=3446120 RepID=UPI003F52F899
MKDLNVKMGFPLKRGYLELSFFQEDHASNKFNHLLAVAERINPKRAFLFVSKVLGKHIPVAPSTMRQSYIDLAEKLDHLANVDSPITFVAMAETAIGLGSGVYSEFVKKHDLNTLFVTTTRHKDNNVPVFCEFLEEHSHAQDQVVHGSNDSKIQEHLKNTKVLVLIDDEVTTGKTFCNLYQSLVQGGMDHIEQVITVTLVDWSDETPTFDRVRWENHSLLSGYWSWTHKDHEAIDMPNVNGVEAGSVEITAPQDWGRVPTFSLPQAWVNLKPKFKGERIHVLGSGEYLWIPFLIAENLEKQGANVVFSSTTRSPIQVGECIQHKLEFADNYGMGMRNYAYNVNPDAYDRLILIVETDVDQVDDSLKAIPNLEIISASYKEPISYVDLDDTLFQTHRRRTPQDTDRVASLDKHLSPLAYMHPKQQFFVDWLAKSTRLIPVTARSVEALSRVQIDFKYGAVCSHGGTVLLPNGEVDQYWLKQQKDLLEPYKQHMLDLEQVISAAASQYGEIRSWVVQENDMSLYYVVKQNSPTPLFLTSLIQHIPSSLRDLFYVHTNGNNLAIIPNVISKKNAVLYLMQKQNPLTPCIGFGDSLSDFDFLQNCDWFGFPKASQLANQSNHGVQQFYSEKGYYGNE